MKYSWHKILPFICITAFLFALTLIRIDDPDIWWHLKCGELFVRNGQILRQDIFSYTAFGSPWVDGYLLAQAMFYVSWLTGGPAGVILFGSLLAVFPYVLSFYLIRGRRRGFGFALAMAIPAILLSRMAIVPRPALFSPIFFILSLYLLEKHSLNVNIKQPKSSKSVYWLIPLTIVWANCHPGFILGFFLTLTYLIVPGLVRLLFRRGVDKPDGPDRKAFRKSQFVLLSVFAGQVLAAFINPYGHKIYYSVKSLFMNPQLSGKILEWVPMFSKPMMMADSIAGFFILIAFGTALFIRNGKRNRPEHVFLFVALALACVYSRRNISIFSPLSLILLAWSVPESENAGHKSVSIEKIRIRAIKLGSILISLASLFLIWFAATDRIYVYTMMPRNTGFGVQADTFPEGAVELLRNENVAGNLFHPFTAGGYLIFHLYPKYRVFMDGRIYPYPADLIDVEQSALFSFDEFGKLEKQYDIRVVILPFKSKEIWPQVKAFILSPEWATVQADGSFILFMRRGAGNDPVIARHEIDLLNNPPAFQAPPDGKTFHLWDRAEYPYGPLRWAGFYQEMGRYDLALRVLKPLLDYRPVVKDINIWYGESLIWSGKPEEGLSIARQELDKNPNNTGALRLMADYYLKVENFSKAEEILERVARIDPNLPEVWNTLGELAFNRQDYGTAAKRFRLAANLKPDERQYWEKLGISFQFFDQAEAEKAFLRAQQIPLKPGDTPADIIRIREQMRQHDETQQGK